MYIQMMILSTHSHITFHPWTKMHIFHFRFFSWLLSFGEWECVHFAWFYGHNDNWMECMCVNQMCALFAMLYCIQPPIRLDTCRCDWFCCFRIFFFSFFLFILEFHAAIPQGIHIYTIVILFLSLTDVYMILHPWSNAASAMFDDNRPELQELNNKKLQQSNNEKFIVTFSVHLLSESEIFNVSI